jgi:aerobic carbon-monoxide dehydrogenase large subunit
LQSSTKIGIGQPVRRREDFRLLTGRGCYSDDFSFAEQAHAVMVRSPHAHARIRAIDTSAAEAAPGVHVVLTGGHMLADGLQAIPHAVGTRHPADITLENRDGSPPFIPPHFPMAAEEARHCGEIVAMVVATTLSAAKDAAELIAVDYEPLPAVAHSVTALQPGAPVARGDAASNVSIDAEVGDRAATDTAFAKAAHIVKFDTWVQRIAGVPMEPRAATGTYDRESGRYTLYAGIGGAVRPKQELAKILDVAEDKVRVVMQEIG